MILRNINKSMYINNPYTQVASIASIKINSAISAYNARIREIHTYILNNVYATLVLIAFRSCDQWFV